MILIMAGGDGSLINLIMNAQNAGVDIKTLKFCVLPYGTGNDFARTTGWGGGTDAKYYKTLKSLVKEVCKNTKEEQFNVWDIAVNFKPRGHYYTVDSRTR
jgi:diacylglycerol kinase (ATP)